MLHHMATILVWYGGHFESKMATKIQKSSDLGKIWFPSRSCSCELIIFIFLEQGAMGWGDVRYCFAMAILVIITSPRLLSGDVLLFYISFSLLLLLHHPDCCQVMYCYSIIILITSPRLLSGDVLLFYVSFSLLLLLLFLLHHPDCCRVMYCYSIIIIIPHIFVRSISRRCLDQTL